MDDLMAGDPQGGSTWFLQTLLGRIDRVSDEFRGDLDVLRGEMASTEKRVMGAIQGVRSEFVEYGRLHAAEHLARSADTDAAHSRFEAFIKASELAQAQRDGALGIIRFMLDLGGRNWKLIAIVLGALGLALGNVQLDVNVR